MQDGSIQTLREVVELYNQGGNLNEQLDPKTMPLDLTDDSDFATPVCKAGKWCHHDPASFWR